MKLKNLATAAAVTLTLAFLACSAEVELNAGSTQCPSGQRFANGACRVECTRNEQCPEGRCLILDESGGICAPADVAPSNECVYLGSDTKCVGVGVYESSTRFGRVSFPYTSDPYSATNTGTTNHSDREFRANAYPNSYNPSDGCKGDATWVAVKATTNPGCAQPHAVTRCRLTDSYRCVLVEGTTSDRPNL